MIRYKCVVSYCGREYAGWQRQTNARSIQGEIEEVLKRITTEDITIVGSGRTDAKVNAKGQVFHFDTNLDMTPYKWKWAINGYLPKDIHLLSIEKTDFLDHARFSVKAKQYDYSINLGEYNVFEKDTVYQYCRPLNIDKMEEASKYLIGTHDFSSFCSNSLEQTPDQVRTVYSIDFNVQNNVLTMSFYGNGFLRYMVRMMAGELIEVGRGRIAPQDIKTILDAKSKTVRRKNAPAEGLTLVKVEYFKTYGLSDKVVFREYLQEDNIIDTPNYVFSSRQNGTIVARAYLEDSKKHNIKIVIQDESYKDDIHALLVAFSENDHTEVIYEESIDR